MKTADLNKGQADGKRKFMQNNRKACMAATGIISTISLLTLLNKKHIVVKELKFVYDKNKENSNVFMIRAVKNAKQGLVVTKPIIITRGE